MKKHAYQIVAVGSHVADGIQNALLATKLFDGHVHLSIGTFGSGELYTELYPDSPALAEEHAKILKNAHVVIVQSASTISANENCMELMMLAHTLRNYGVTKITAVMPFAPFARQDRPMKNRFTSVAADLLPRILSASGIDSVLTVTPHSKDGVKLWQDEFQQKFIALDTTDLFADFIRDTLGNNAGIISIGAPDGADKAADQGQERARNLAKAVFNDAAADPRKMFHISKTHTSASQTEITGFDGDVIGKDCVVIDDMVDGGSTIINAANLLKQKGAKSVTACITHAVLSPSSAGRPALDLLLDQSSLDHLVLCDTIPDAAEKIKAFKAKEKPESAKKITLLSVGNLIIKALEKECAPQVRVKPPSPPSA